jgi:hypothetical protein
MHEWEAAVEKFLIPWRRREVVIGALIAGSYVTGKPNPRSDLDLYIVTKPGTKWRERGNKVIDGFLIEYFANPPEQIRKYFADNFAQSSAMSLTPYTTGRILFDKDGVLAQLRRDAQRWLDKPRRRLRRADRSIEAYRLWDGLDNLQDAFERGAPDVAYVYHHALCRLFEIYTRSLGQIVPGVSKTHGLLTSDDVRRKYSHPAYPDPTFARAFVAAMAEREPPRMLERLRKLTKHVHDRWGGFVIDGFSARTPVEAGSIRYRKPKPRRGNVRRP